MEVPVDLEALTQDDTCTYGSGDAIHGDECNLHAGGSTVHHCRQDSEFRVLSPRSRFGLLDGRRNAAKK